MKAPLESTTVSSPVALLADVHGNLRALEAVLAELARRDVSEVYVAGDLLFGGPEPLGTWKRLTAARAHCVRGLSDTALATLDPAVMTPRSDAEKARLAQFFETRAAVGELVLKYLERLPPTLRIPLVDGREVVVVHGSPADPTIEMSHDMTDDELLSLLGDDPADIVACGGSHVPFQRDVEGARILGLGSVGASPEGGVAHFAILTPRLEGTVVEQCWVRWDGQA